MTSSGQAASRNSEILLIKQKKLRQSIRGVPRVITAPKLGLFARMICWDSLCQKSRQQSRLRRFPPKKLNTISAGLDPSATSSTPKGIFLQISAMARYTTSSAESIPTL